MTQSGHAEIDELRRTSHAGTVSHGDPRGLSRPRAGGRPGSAYLTPSRERRLADSLQSGRRLLFLALAGLVNEIECHRRSLESLSPIINRPNGVGLRKLIYECLNEWVRHFAGSLCSVDERENWRLFPLHASRYQTAFIA